MKAVKPPSQHGMRAWRSDAQENGDPLIFLDQGDTPTRPSITLASPTSNTNLVRFAQPPTARVLLTEVRANRKEIGSREKTGLRKLPMFPSQHATDLRNAEGVKRMRPDVTNLSRKARFLINFARPGYRRL
jgi:hypothetical protein